MLSLPAVPRPRVLFPPGAEPIAAPEEDGRRDPLAQLATIIGEPQAADLTGRLDESLTGLDPSDDGPMMWL
ncbi:hypothetical protein ACU635_08435 [[Actinomadura] parvosata]|uniref:hypothetical protein n=1 Tax=[Actinomadura] parvosata TaxID=1955412 RepID=UPI00406C9A7E